MAAGAVGAVLVGATVLRIRAMEAAHYALVGDEARTAVDALLSGSRRPLLGVPTTSSEFIDRTLMNPGPILQYSLYPFVRLMGTDRGAWTYSATLGLMALGIAAWASTRRAGGAAGITVSTVMLLMLLVVNTGGLMHSLNTEVVLLPTFCCFVLAWVVAAGDSEWLPVLGIGATFIVQTFVGSAPMVLPTCLVAVVWLGWGVHREGPPHHLRRHVAIAAAAIAVLWLPPLADELFRTGNMSGLLGFRTPGRGVAGAAQAMGSILDPFIYEGGSKALHASLWGPLLTVAAWIAVVATASGRRAAVGLRHLLGVAAAAVAGSLMITFADPPTDTATYHFFNLGLARYLVLLCLALIAVAVVQERLATRSDPVRRRISAAATAAGLLLLTMLGVSVVSMDHVDPRRRVEMHAVNALSSQIERTSDPDDLMHIVSRGGSGNGNVAQGIVAQLRSAGIPANTGFSRLRDRDRVLVVDDLAPVGDDEVVAAFHPPGRVDSAFDPEQVLDWARRHPPVELSPSGRDNLTDRLDGSVPALCIDALLDSPDHLLDLPPGPIIRMLVNGEIQQPEIAGAMRDWAYDWDIHQGFEVVELPPGGSWQDGFTFDELFLSESSCP